MTWTLSGFADEIDPDLETQCRLLDQLGIGHIELRSAWNVNVLDLTDEQLDEVEKVLAAHSIAVSSIGSPIGKVNIEDDFDEHLVRLDRALAVAARLRAPYIRIFSFFLRPDQPPADHRDEVIRRMRAMAERAEGTGVVLLHENEKEIFGDVPERVLDIVESVDRPTLKLAWDAANYVQCGVRPFTQAYDRLRPHTVYIQVKDAVLATGEVVAAGEGDGQVRETISALRADGYDGFFSMEPHLAAVNPLGGFSGAAEFTRATNAFTALLDNEGITYA
ncbi:Sugar phosphate isomerase/epimerase [Nakamurella panacisegetis]|uniref:Sugar phosphate isomerase/epimerase n=1 Tax=Nakamurella panacisegetis TaxID=1090615 RepID=A0A1H0N5J5_9ACTN|nr:sugar phosphate isomerase/epimerase [Nakamurella panacisegetis]SDO87948.1 Sugar phosphate isomerase/epimerase [Nakamurella panacisegetis]